MDINDSSNLSFELSYKTLQEKEIWLGKVTEKQTNIRLSHVNLNVNTPAQCVSGNHPTSNPSHGSIVYNDENAFINIQLPYDSDASTNTEI